MDSVWVLTGVHGVTDLALGTATPTYAVLALDELHQPYSAVERGGERWHYEHVRVGRSVDELVVELDSVEPESAEARRGVLRAGVAMVCDLRDSGLDRKLLCPLRPLLMPGRAAVRAAPVGSSVGAHLAQRRASC